MVSVGASLLPSDDGDNDVARSAAENGHEHVGKRMPASSLPMQSCPSLTKTVAMLKCSNVPHY